MRSSKALLLTILAVVCLLLSACAAPTSTPAPSPIPVQPTATLRPSQTPTPVPTETSRPTLTPTLALSPTVTNTAAPTVDPSLSQVKLIGLGWLPNYDFLLTFQFPNPVKPENFRVTMEEKTFTCEVLAQFPDRLYCHGPGAAVYTTAWVRLYQTGSDQPAYESERWIPYFTIEHLTPPDTSNPHLSK